jgi:glycosyltransferase involved in cell wall biosynthesis
VRVVGAVTPEEIPELLRGARALFLPSLWFEGQPRVALEAYAAGIPVVASRIGSLPDVVREGETGLMVAPGDLEGWRDAARVLASDEVSLRFGEAAYLRWSDDFSPERGLALLEAAYREALGNGGSAR